jgi:DNA repair protein RecO (recombination protein O)
VTTSSAVSTDALLLRAVDYRESDRIVTFFTAELGMVSAIARGAKSSKRRFSGTLEPYLVVKLELEPARGELMTLKRAELVRGFSAILSDLARMEVAGAALSLLRDAHPARVPNVPMFVGALQYLTLVDVEGDAQRAALLAFALRVLSLSGMAPRFDACGRSGEPVPTGRPAYFDAVLGAVVAKRFGGGPLLLPAALRARLIRALGDEWVQAAREDWSAEHLQVARSAVAALIASHLTPELASRLFP